MKIELGIKLRLDLMGIFPQKSNFIERQIAVDIRKKLDISADERTSVDMKVQGQNIIWDISKENPFEIEFSSVEIEYMKTCVDMLDKERSITDANFEVCKMIRGLRFE